MTPQNNRSGIIYEITQNCPFKCPICLRHLNPIEARLSVTQRQTMIQRLHPFNIGRITVTGGEPTILGDELYDFLKFVHQEKIHSCLCTSGLNLTANKILEMDSYLDQILLSLRSFDPQEWKYEYGDAPLIEVLYPTVMNILEWSKSTQIILVINFVLHKKNIARVIEFGEQLASINRKLTWRITEYYGIGLSTNSKSDFELSDEEFAQARETITSHFKNVFNDLMFLSKRQLERSFEYVITPSGDLITTDHYQIHPSGFNLVQGPVPQTIQALRPWSAFLKACRDWGWGDF